MSRKIGTVQSMVMCCASLSDDVKNILVGGHKQQFPSNWKAPRHFRLWCYLAAALPSWPSMRDEPLYMSSLPLWIEPKLHHHSNGFLACTLKRHGHSTDCLKEGAADSEALKLCVCVRLCVCNCDLVFLRVSPRFARMNYRLDWRRDLG